MIVFGIYKYPFILCVPLALKTNKQKITFDWVSTDLCFLIYFKMQEKEGKKKLSE